MSRADATTSSVTPLAFDELAPTLQDALRPRYERLGYLGGFFTHMAHQPEALVHFDAFTETLKSALGPELTETIALTAATRLANTYERHQHERLAVARGLGADWVAAIERLDPDSLDPASLDHGAAIVAAQQFVLAACDGLGGGAAGSSAEALDRLVAVSDEATAAGVALLTGRFVAHAVIAAACRLQPPVASIFESEEQ